MMRIDVKRIRDMKEKQLKETIDSMDKNKLSMTIIRVIGDDASAIYVNNKKKKLESLGITVNIVEFEKNCNTKEIIDVIHNDSTSGVLVQLPLPKHLDEELILESIPESKDVDCLTKMSQGRLALGDVSVLPCTVQACIDIINSEKVEDECDDFAELDFLVLGRSKLVGMPLSIALTHMNGTVRTLHTKSWHTPEHHLMKANEYDFIISATGVHGILDGPLIPKFSTFIDVGINRDENNKLCGDLRNPNETNRISNYTPVPGGVGLLTVLNVADNLVKLIKRGELNEKNL